MQFTHCYIHKLITLAKIQGYYVSNNSEFIKYCPAIVIKL